MEATKTYHHQLALPSNGLVSYIWEEENTIPFDDLIISWNAMRPQYGGFHIAISVKTESWTPWFLYASWTSAGQRGGMAFPRDVPLKIELDIIELLNGVTATGFRIRLEAVDGAVLDEFYFLHACASRPSALQVEDKAIGGPAVDLNVPLVSQFVLPHPRHRDMCSASSTSAAVSFLLKKNCIDPIFFAIQARDEASDIFGNWVLNMAHASSIMGKEWCCWVQRLQGFDDIYARLRNGTPVVVSIKGALKGALYPYENGHLIVVKGFNPEDNKVLCMDPAYPQDIDTNVSYDLKDFLAAWSRRKYIAYMFTTPVSNCTQNAIDSTPELSHYPK